MMAKTIAEGKKLSVMYSDDIAGRICEQIAIGRSIKEIEAMPGFPTRDSIYKWIMRYPEFHERYWKARELQAEVHAEGIIERAREAYTLVEKCEDPKKANAIVNAIKLEITAFQWNATKLLPKKYGEKLAVEHSIDDSLAKRLERAETQLLEARNPRTIDAKVEVIPCL